jgi:hypothetical protein
MLRIAADRALAARLGHAARVHIESHHSTLISNKRLWEIIESSTPGMRS